MSKFTLKSNIYDIELNLEHKNNIILGNSGTGKTFLCNLIRVISDDEFTRSNFKSNFDLNEVLTISSKRELKGFDWNRCGRVVFIDRDDLYLTKEDAIKINKSQNIFYIMSRDTGGKLPLDLVLESYLTLNHREKDGKHYLRTKYFM